MNQLTTIQKTMSSKELLEIINQVRLDMGEPLLRLNSFNLKIEDELEGQHYTKNVVENTNATMSYVYDLTIDQCILIGMRESKSVRKSILEKLKSLDPQAIKPQLPDFTNPVEAARAWANEVEAKQIAQQHLAIAAPKAEYFDRVAERTALLNATQVGQKVGMSAVIMNRHLDELKVYNKSIKRSRVFQQWFIDLGLGELKQTDSGHPQAMFTVKGEQWVVQKFTSEGLV